MSSTMHSPMNSAFSLKKNDSRFEPKVRVRSARMMLRRSLPSFHSPKRPEGMSIDTMKASLLLMYCTSAV